MSSILTVFAFWLMPVLFVVAAIALVVTPLFRRSETQPQGGRRSINIAIYRDQMRELENDRRNGLLSTEQFETTRLELEARLALDALTADDDAQPVNIGTRRLGLTLTALIPAVAFGLYFLIGNPAAIVATANAQGEMTADASQSMDDLLKKVEGKVVEKPEDVEARMLLGKTYGMLGRWTDAEQAYAVAYSLAADNATVLAYYAEAIAKASGRQLKGRPAELLNQALELNPDETKALELAGVRAYQNKEFAMAAYYWKRLTKLLPPDDPYTKDMAAHVKQAKSMAARASFGAPMADPADQKKAADPAKTLAGMVEIAPALQAKLKGTETVFLFARQVGKSDAPLVSMSTSVTKLPLAFQLDDSLTADLFNDLENVVLLAHISMTGEREVKAGDFEGQLKKVKLGSQDVKLVIDTVRK